MFEIKDNSLITKEQVFCIKTKHDKIEVIGEIPISSRVFCIAKCGMNTYSFPLMYKETTNTGNVFSSIFFVDDGFLNHYRLNENAECCFSIKVDNCLLENTQKLSISPRVSANNSIFKDSILKEINSLKQDLVAFKSNTLETNTNMKKGMIPIATGLGEEYLWDYPFSDLHNKLVKTIELEKQIAECISDLTKRVNDLETKILDHIYESYNI